MNPIFNNIFWSMRFDSQYARRLSDWSLLTRRDLRAAAFDERPWILRWGPHETNVVYFSATASVRDVLNTLGAVISVSKRDSVCFRGLKLIHQGDLPEYEAVLIDVCSI